MKLEKAIKRLTKMSELEFVAYGKNDFDAIKLGIEALKRLSEGRLKGYDYFGHSLPGETKD